MEEVFAYLSRFGRLAKGVQQRILKKSKRLHYKKNSLLVKEGTHNMYAYFIIRGMVRAYYYDNKGQEISAWFLAEGELIAPAQSYVYNEPSAESIQALEDCEVIRLPFREIDRLYDDFPSFNRIGRLLAMFYSFNWYNHAKELKIGTVEDRYRTLCEKHPQIIQRVPKKYIASYLKTTPTYLSRVRM